MGRVKINTGRPYEVTIEAGLLKEIDKHLMPWQGRDLFIITDETVGRLYGGVLTERLEAQGWIFTTMQVIPGETSKSFETLSEVLEAMAQAGLNRGSLILALGGGVPGDLAGFAAATYMRGIDYIQVPTTLLAMVDSSVGGKTAVNLKAGKNLAGAFHQPLAVLADPDVLKTLPEEVWDDGMAEVIKYGVLYDEDLFQRTAGGVKKDHPDLADLLTRCVGLKKLAVEQDEKDLGLRQLLNFGHTFGHAMEKASDFKLSHGHAVAAGMAMMSRACFRRGISSEATVKRIVKALVKNHLPVTNELPLGDLLSALRRDKKAMGSGGSETIQLVVVEEIGTCRLLNVPMDALGSWLEDTI